jgi:hypothetical protein
MKTLITVAAAIIMSLLAGCSSASQSEVRLTAMRLDSIHLLILAHVRSDDSVQLPRYLHTGINGRTKRTQGDTLVVLFDCEQVWQKAGLVNATSNDLDRAMTQASRREYDRVLAFIEGRNSDVEYLRLGLYGVDGDIVLRVGDYKAVYPKRIAVSEVFIGGYAK